MQSRKIALSLILVFRRRKTIPQIVFVAQALARFTITLSFQLVKELSKLLNDPFRFSHQSQVFRFSATSRRSRTDSHSPNGTLWYLTLACLLSNSFP